MPNKSQKMRGWVLWVSGWKHWVKSTARAKNGRMPDELFAAGQQESRWIMGRLDSILQSLVGGGGRS